MKVSFQTIFAVSVMLIGFTSYADQPGPNYPPPQQQQYPGQYQQQVPGQYDDGDCDQGQCAPPDYYGPGQAGLYGYYDEDCLPDFDPSLYYRCPSQDVFACGPVDGGIYGTVYPYPAEGLPIAPVLANRWWGAYGPYVSNIYRRGYRGRFLPMVRQGVQPNMIRPGMPLAQRGIYNPGIQRGIYNPGIPRGPMGPMPGMIGPRGPIGMIPGRIGPGAGFPRFRR